MMGALFLFDRLRVFYSIAQREAQERVNAAIVLKLISMRN